MMINIIHFLCLPAQKSVLKVISRIFKSFAEENALEESILPILHE